MTIHIRLSYAIFFLQILSCKSISQRQSVIQDYQHANRDMWEEAYVEAGKRSTPPKDRVKGSLFHETQIEHDRQTSWLEFVNNTAREFDRNQAIEFFVWAEKFPPEIHTPGLISSSPNNPNREIRTNLTLATKSDLVNVARALTDVAKLTQKKGTELLKAAHAKNIAKQITFIKSIVDFPLLSSQQTLLNINIGLQLKKLAHSQAEILHRSAFYCKQLQEKVKSVYESLTEQDRRLCDQASIAYDKLWERAYQGHNAQLKSIKVPIGVNQGKQAGLSKSGTALDDVIAFEMPLRGPPSVWVNTDGKSDQYNEVEGNISADTTKSPFNFFYPSGGYRRIIWLRGENLSSDQGKGPLDPENMRTAYNYAEEDGTDKPVLRSVEVWAKAESSSGPLWQPFFFEVYNGEYIPQIAFKSGTVPSECGTCHEVKGKLFPQPGKVLKSQEDYNSVGYNSTQAKTLFNFQQAQ